MKQDKNISKNVEPQQLKATEKRTQGRNLRKDEVKQFIVEFVSTVREIRINGKPFANKATTKVIGTNPDLSIEEIQHALGVPDKTKVDFLRQLYIRGGSAIIKKLFPDENIVNIPIISFEETGNAINLSY
jgi:hypothetical protein